MGIDEARNVVVCYNKVFLYQKKKNKVEDTSQSNEPPLIKNEDGLEPKNTVSWFNHF
jgi:hypothetical protein